HWLPFLPRESLQDYARRVAASLDPTPPFILAGLSFGGMLALEVATHLRPQAVIAISAATAFHQLAPPAQLACRLIASASDTAVRQSLHIAPLFFRLVGRTNRHQRRLLLTLSATANPTLARRS